MTKLLTDDEYARLLAESGTTRPGKPGPHPLCTKLRDIRTAAGISLSEFERRYKIPAVVIGSYERGDRIPSIERLDAIYSIFGYRISVIPNEDTPVVRTKADMARDLRSIAEQIHPSIVEPVEDGETVVDSPV